MQFVIAVSLGIYLFGEAVLLLIGRQASHEMGNETEKAAVVECRLLRWCWSGGGGGGGLIVGCWVVAVKRSRNVQ